jgi:RNA polymerase-binding transcription factor DksA
MMANQAWKPALLRKGKEVAELLEAVLWGKEVDLSCLPAPASPAEDPELRLRSFLDQIDRAIKAFDTDRYGRCEVCGVDLDRRAMDQQPWLATCPAHAGRWAC